MNIFSRWRGKKTNPNKPNLKRARMNINSIITKGYRKKDDFEVRINKPNLRKAQNERKLIYYRGLQKKRHFHSPGKQSQFKPNFETTTCLSFFRIPYMKPERDRSQAIPCPKIGRGTVSTNSRTVPLSGIFTA